MSITEELPEDFDFQEALVNAVLSFLTTGDMAEVEISLADTYDLDDFQVGDLLDNFAGVIYTAAENVESKVTGIIVEELEKIRTGEVPIVEFNSENLS